VAEVLEPHDSQGREGHCLDHRVSYANPLC
jgi:hypothetical protein